jgi:hypothetical protein
MKSEKKKKTVGTQIIENITKASETRDKGPEVREVTKEWGKKFLNDLEKILRDPKYTKWSKIYIKVLAKKPIQTENMVNVVYGVTNIPPSPDWKNMLYSYDREKNQIKIEWILPQAPAIAKVMLAHQDGFDSFLIQCIKDFLNGKLIGQNTKT